MSRVLLIHWHAAEGRKRLAGKLGIRRDSLVALLDAPAGFERRLEGLPPGVRLARHLRSRPRTILLFSRARAGLARRFPGAAR